MSNHHVYYTTPDNHYKMQQSRSLETMGSLMYPAYHQNDVASGPPPSGHAPPPLRVLFPATNGKFVMAYHDGVVNRPFHTAAAPPINRDDFVHHYPQPVWRIQQDQARRLYNVPEEHYVSFDME